MVPPESKLVELLAHLLAQLIVRPVSLLEQAFLPLTQPSHHSTVLATAAELTRRQADLKGEHILHHHQANLPSLIHVLKV